MKRTLFLLALAFAAPVWADCPEPTEQQKEQLRWCETHPGCMIDAKLAKDCAGIMARIRESFSRTKKEIDSPEYGEGDLDKERRARAEQAAPLIDRRTPAEIKAAEQFHAADKAEADAINAMRIDDRICEREPFGDACNAAIETYLARRARVAAYRKAYGVWNKEIEDLRLTLVENAIEARAIRAQNAAPNAIKRDATVSPDLASVDAAIEAYERYDAQRPQRVAAEQAAAARQQLIDDENARRYAAEAAQRDAESREALQDSLKALVQSIEAQSAPASENQAPPPREQQDCGVYDGNGVYVGPHSC